ncbi:hypothetical protein GA632_09515, partial [Bifidobacterium adolescentis]
VGQRHAGHAGGVRFRRCGRRPPGLRRGGIHRQAPLAHGPQPARRREGGAGRGRHLHPAAAPAGMGRHHPQKPGPHARPHAFGAARMAAARGRAGVRRAKPREDAGGAQSQPAAGGRRHPRQPRRRGIHGPMPRRTSRPGDAGVPVLDA